MKHSLFFIAVLPALALPAAASEPIGLVTSRGAYSIEREGLPRLSRAEVATILQAGDVLRMQDATGRITRPTGEAIILSQSSRVALESTDMVRLDEGGLVLSSPEGSPQEVRVGDLVLKPLLPANDNVQPVSTATPELFAASAQHLGDQMVRFTSLAREWAVQNAAGATVGVLAAGDSLDFNLIRSTATIVPGGMPGLPRMQGEDVGGAATGVNDQEEGDKRRGLLLLLGAGGAVAVTATGIGVYEVAIKDDGDNNGKEEEPTRRVFTSVIEPPMGEYPTYDGEYLSPPYVTR